MKYIEMDAEKDTDFLDSSRIDLQAAELL